MGFTVVFLLTFLGFAEFLPDKVWSFYFGLVLVPVDRQEKSIVNIEWGKSLITGSLRPGSRLVGFPPFCTRWMKATLATALSGDCCIATAVQSLFFFFVVKLYLHRFLFLAIKKFRRGKGGAKKKKKGQKHNRRRRDQSSNFLMNPNLETRFHYGGKFS